MEENISLAIGNIESAEQLEATTEELEYNAPPMPLLSSHCLLPIYVPPTCLLCSSVPLLLCSCPLPSSSLLCTLSFLEATTEELEYNTPTTQQQRPFLL